MFDESSEDEEAMYDSALAEAVEKYILLKV
jgi:hypothetical protein